MRTFGYVKSTLSASDASVDSQTGILPGQYDLRAQLPDVRDQGSVSKCVSCSVTDMLIYKSRSEDRNLTIKDDFFFKERYDKKIDGMSPKEAFEIAKSNYKLKLYAKVGSAEIAKKSILVYGVVLIALPCYNDTNDFWLKSGALMGGHAVTLVGWNNNGFILRNSWGTSYGTGGYHILPYDKFNSAYECWVIIS